MKYVVSIQRTLQSPTTLTTLFYTRNSRKSEINLHNT